MKDTWPKEHGTPTLLRSLEMIKWVVGCLGEDAHQDEAANQLLEAQRHIVAALRELAL